MATETFSSPKSAFWSRQFSPEPTRTQVRFDVSAGILLPIVCFVFDPVVFRSLLPFEILEKFAVASYLTAGLGIAGLVLWLLCRRPAALLAGVLAAGGLFAAGVGVALLPLSLGGLFLVIGILGFSPFLTAFVFLRNAIRAFATARVRLGGKSAIAIATIAFTANVGIAFKVHAAVRHEVARATDRVLHADAAHASSGVKSLVRFGCIQDWGPIVVAFDADMDPGRKKTISDAYRQATRRDFEDLVGKLSD